MVISRAPRWLACIVLTSFLQCAIADDFIVDDIQVEGLNRISPGTVFNYLPITVGDTVNDERTQAAVRALFKTGFFKDVQLDREGDVLVVRVVERETIADITFEGNKAIKTEELEKGLGEAGFAKGEVYNESKMDKVVQELRRQYYSNGKYGVKIEPTITPLDDNTLTIHFKISEGEAALIKQINIVGNEAFSDKEILRDFKLTTPTWTSWFTKDDQYSKQKLSGDLESLRSKYQDNGYIDFRVDSTQVSITPDKADVYVTINITEGEQYKVSGVKLAGKLIVDEKELFQRIETVQGELFSRKSVTQTTKNITDRLGDEGYAFANVNAIPKMDKPTRTVALTYFVDPGQRVYVRRVNFSGNSKTRDEVLRREMRQLEGGWISTKWVERSKIRLQRLGYFEEVNVETPAVAGMTDQVDVNYTVKERPSGNLMLGVGFSQSQGIIFNTSVTQDNFLGSGKSVSAAFNNSDYNTLFRLGYMNPYWTIDGISRGFNVSYQEVDAGGGNNNVMTRYNTETMSGGVSFGIPLTEYNSFAFGAAYEASKLDVSPFFQSYEVANFIFREGNEFNVLRMNVGFSYDSRNSTIFPTDGMLQSIRAEVAVPGGDLNFYKLDYDSRYFFPLGRDFVLLLKGRVGYGDSYGDTYELPFFENFYAGGPRTVRGYQEFSLGPKDIYGNALGGHTMVVGNAEIILPIPFLREIKSVRVSTFFDAGNVFGTYLRLDPETGLLYRAKDTFDVSELRLSAGIGAMWLSPFGMLSVSVAQPFNYSDSRDPLTGRRIDEIQKFQFTFGTNF